MARINLPSNVGQDVFHGERRVPAAQSFDAVGEDPSGALINERQVRLGHKEHLGRCLGVLGAALNPQRVDAILVDTLDVRMAAERPSLVQRGGLGWWHSSGSG